MAEQDGPPPPRSRREALKRISLTLAASAVPPAFWIACDNPPGPYSSGYNSGGYASY